MLVYVGLGVLVEELVNVDVGRGVNVFVRVGVAVSVGVKVLVSVGVGVGIKRNSFVTNASSLPLKLVS